MNNVGFGKSKENAEKRVDIKLVTHWDNIGRKLEAEPWIAKPHIKDGENLVAINMAKQKLYIINQYTILDISKTIKYGNEAVWSRGESGGEKSFK